MRDINIEIDIEFIDGCLSQYKCVQEIQSFARRNVSSIRLYFETSHGNSKYDCLWGVVKGYASREVAATNTVIRNTAELYQFCNEKLTVLGSDEHEKMLNCLFFSLPKQNIESYRSSFPSSRVYRPIPGTLKIHQIMNKISERNGVYKQNFSSFCKFCHSNDYENCICLDNAKFVDNKDQVRLIWHAFREKGERSAKVREDKAKYSSSSEDSASESEKEIDYEETDRLYFVKCHDAVAVFIGEGFPYYLVKLSKDPFTTTECVKDDYGHYIPANTKQ